MTEKILSVIIPAYNAEQYLSKCLSSFIFPGMNLLEIIIVNDGSSDRTPEIARKYVSRYPEIFQVIDQENKGHGGCINTACVLARGKYLRVVDADDWVLTKNLERYLNALQNTEADIVFTHFHTVEKKSHRRTDYKNTGLPYNISHSSKMLTPVMKQAAHWFSLHSITYRTEFYQNISLKLTEKIAYEDTEFAVLPFINCKNVLLLNLFLYEYLVGNSTQSVSISNYSKQYKDLEKVLFRILDQYKKIKGKQKTISVFLQRRLCMLLVTYEKIMLIYFSDRSFGSKRVSRIRNDIKAVDSQILQKTQIRHLMLKFCHIIKLSPKLLESLYSCYNRLKNIYKFKVCHTNI